MTLMRSTTGVLSAALLMSMPWASVAQPGTNEPVDIGTRRELFVDRDLIASLSGGAQQRMQRPVLREIAIKHDAPWEGTGCGYHNVFKDGDTYRMYYNARHLGCFGGGPPEDGSAPLLPVLRGEWRRYSVAEARNWA